MATTQELIQHDMIMQTLIEQQEMNLFATLKPKFYKDGNSWCVLLGDNIQDGICGFGDSLYLAILDFNKSFHRTINPY